MKANKSIIDIWKYLRGDIDSNEFESWLYNNYKEIESELSKDIFSELISCNYKKNEVLKALRHLLVKTFAKYNYECFCHEKRNVDIVPMAAKEDKFFKTVSKVTNRSENIWWVTLYKCSICNQSLLLGQESRINDIYCIKKVNDKEYFEIVQYNKWPNDFDFYSTLLLLGKKFNYVFKYFDPLNSKELYYTIIDIANVQTNIRLSKLYIYFNEDFEIIKEISKRAIENEKVIINLYK